LSPGDIVEWLRALRERRQADWQSRANGTNGNADTLVAADEFRATGAGSRGAGTTEQTSVIKVGTPTQRTELDADAQQIRMKNGGTTKILLDAGTDRLIQVNDATVTAVLDIPNQKISINNATLTAVLDISGTGKLQITDGAKTIVADLAQLNTGATAQFRDLAVKSVEYDSTNKKFVTRTQTVRVLAEAIPVGTTADLAASEESKPTSCTAQAS
jgi:hypothetical protein